MTPSRGTSPLGIRSSRLSLLTVLLLAVLFVLTMVSLTTSATSAASCAPDGTVCAGVLLAILGVLGGVLFGVLAIGVVTVVFAMWGIVAVVFAADYAAWGYLASFPTVLVFFEIILVVGLVLVWMGLSWSVQGRGPSWTSGSGSS